MCPPFQSTIAEAEISVQESNLDHLELHWFVLDHGKPSAAKQTGMIAFAIWFGWEEDNLLQSCHELANELHNAESDVDSCNVSIDFFLFKRGGEQVD